MAGFLAAIPGIVGAASGIAGQIYGMTRAGPGVSSEEAAWRDWTRTIEPAGTMMNQLFYNPAFKGSEFPYSGAFNLPENARTTQWAPSKSTEQLYKGYLNRQYGLPNRMAGAMSAQAMLPLRSQGIGQGNINAAGARSAYGLDPQAMVQSQVSRQEPEAIRQFDYLKNAGELSQYNLWRVQQLPRLIG